VTPIHFPSNTALRFSTKVLQTKMVIARFLNTLPDFNCWQLTNLDMNKIILAMLALLTFHAVAVAQQQLTNTWVMGSGSLVSNPFEPGFGGSIIHFSPSGIDTTRFIMDYEMWLSSAVSDEVGNLLFYSNGCEVYNKNQQIMPNGNALIEGETYELGCKGTLGFKGYNEFQGLLTLPWPGHEKQYYLVYIFQNKPYIAKNEIRTAIVDMRLDAGLGDVVEKNTPVFTESTSNWFLTATRHGNGRDWWITTPEARTNNFFVYLLDSLGLHGPDIQPVGYFPEGLGGKGQACFSPDGSKFAQVVFYSGQLLDFNRCTGKFYNAAPVLFDTIGSDFSGVAFSQNSRYMYVSQVRKLYQFDLSVENFNETITTIATYEDNSSPIPEYNPYMYSMLLAPDDKIYMNTPGLTNALHIIHHPNEAGLASGFERSGFLMPTFHYGQMPNHPYSRLGALDPPCGNCDTLTRTTAFAVFPNPAGDYVVVSNPTKEQNTGLVFLLYDALGRLLREEKICCLPHRIDLYDLPAAGYFYKVLNADGRELDTGTMVKVN
jgi:hypothetical protein